MGCLIKLLIVLPLTLLFIIPAMFISLFRRPRNVGRRQTTDGYGGNGNPFAGRSEAQSNQSAKPDKPIDESEVEFIEFEEIKDNSVQ